MPPPRRDSQSPEPTGGNQDFNWALHWSWPSRVGRDGEDVEDQLGAIRRRCRLLLEVAQLSRAQLVVDEDEVDVELGARLLEHADLAPAEVEGRVRRRPFLDEAQHDRRAGCPGQAVQLFEAVLGCRLGDDTGGEADQRRALPPAVTLAAGNG